MAGPEPGDRGKLAGLRSRPDLNGRRVEVKGPAAGKDGPPRVAVRLLPGAGAGAGAEVKVKAAILELDGDGGTDPGLDALVQEMEELGAPAPDVAPEDQRDWAGGLPDEVVEKVAGKVVAQTEAGWAAQLKAWDNSEEEIQEEIEERKQDGNCLFVFAMVCKQWRKAQQKVGGPLCTRVRPDVILPGSAALVKWALAEGCPRADERGYTMANAAAQQGQLELVKWLCGEGGFAMDEGVMANAAAGGNLELVRWLRGEGCVWGAEACMYAAEARGWRSCSGCGPMAARGTPGRATTLSPMATWRCCVGPARTAASGTPASGTGRPLSSGTPTTSAT